MVVGFDYDAVGVPDRNRVLGRGEAEEERGKKFLRPGEGAGGVASVEPRKFAALLRNIFSRGVALEEGRATIVWFEVSGKVEDREWRSSRWVYIWMVDLSRRELRREGEWA